MVGFRNGWPRTKASSLAPAELRFQNLTSVLFQTLLFLLFFSLRNRVSLSVSVTQSIRTSFSCCSSETSRNSHKPKPRPRGSPELCAWRISVVALEVMSALEELQEFFNADPDTERISLRAKSLEHIDAEMEYLQLHFAHIRHLDLSENELEALPIDFGSFLPKLVALDITKNRFRSVADLGEVLQQCASLKSLSVTLKSATEEKLLLVMLPKLRILNGTPLSSPVSPPPPSLAANELPVKAVHALSTALLSPSTASDSSVGEGEGDEHHRRSLSSSPPSAPRSSTVASPQDKRMLRLQFANLKIERQAVEQEQQRSAAPHAQEVLALTRKVRRAVNSTATSGPGSSLAVRAKSSSVRPTEKPATISDDKTDWHKLLKSQKSSSSIRDDQSAVGAAHNHEQLQLQPLREATVATATTIDSFLSQLKTIVKTFHQCDAKGKQDGSSSSSSANTQQLIVYEQLDRHVDLLASQLSRQESEEQRQKNVDISDNSSGAASASTTITSDIARMKKSIAMLQTRWNLLEVCGMYGVEKANGVNGTLGKAFEKLLQMQKEVLVALQHQQATITAKAQLASKSQQQDPGTSCSTSNSNVQQHEQQMKVLLEVAECLESDLEAAQMRLQQEKAQRELLEQENWSLKRENEAFKRKPRVSNNSSSTTTPHALLATMSDRDGSTNAATVGTARQRIRKRTATTAEPRPSGPYTAMQTSPLVSRQKSPGTKVSDSNIRAPLYSTEPPPAAPAQSAAALPVRIRNFTLKQLVDLIQCIMISKLKYDTRSFEVGAPRETVEQHMYTYLNQRFGLKSLIVDYASAIWKGCEAFQKQENDAKMFLALLKNQVDEGFLSIKKKLKQALVDLLRAYFQAKFPLKQELAIATLVQNRIQNQIFEEEWQEMLTYLYDPQDSSTLLRLVKQKAEKLQQLNQMHTRTRTTSLKTKAGDSLPVALPFTVFEQVLYDYQLQGRTKLLEEFRQAFESHDSERVGIVNHESFALIVRRIAPKKSATTIEKLLETLDPFHYNVVTFSDAVSCLMGDIRAKRPSPPKPTTVFTVSTSAPPPPAQVAQATTTRLKSKS